MPTEARAPRSVATMEEDVYAYLMRACVQCGDADGVRWLLPTRLGVYEEDPYSHAERMQLLRQAAMLRHVRVVRVLLSRSLKRLPPVVVECLARERRWRMETLRTMASVRHGTMTSMTFDCRVSSTRWAFIHFLKSTKFATRHRGAVLAAILLQRRVGRFRGMELVEPIGREVLSWL